MVIESSLVPRLRSNWVFLLSGWGLVGLLKLVGSTVVRLY